MVDDLYPFRDGKLWGFRTQSGQVVIAPRFEGAGSFSEGFARVKVKGKWGFVNRTGDMVIEPVFDQARFFQNGYAKVQQGAIWGYVDTEGFFVENLNDPGSFLDKTGEFISERDYKNWGKPPHSRE